MFLNSDRQFAPESKLFSNAAGNWQVIQLPLPARVLRKFWLEFFHRKCNSFSLSSVALIVLLVRWSNLMVIIMSPDILEQITKLANTRNTVRHSREGLFFITLLPAPLTHHPRLPKKKKKKRKEKIIIIKACKTRGKSVEPGPYCEMQIPRLTIPISRSRRREAVSHEYHDSCSTN